MDEGSGRLGARGSDRNSPGFLHFAGSRYWTASLLPAFAGTTLPFWLRPPGFSFKWLGATEFLLATVLFHAGFSMLQARFENRSTGAWPGRRLLRTALVCIAGGCLLGVHLNSGLTLHKGVPSTIFTVYGLSVLLVGVLYVVPPFNFWRRAGGEIFICEAMGLIPVLGAYVVQVGDLTRTVYLASGPLVAATALWVWTDELITRMNDEKEGRQTMVVLFGPRFSARFIMLTLSVAFCAAFFMAAFASAIPWWSALIALVLFGPVWRIVVVSWREYEDSPRMTVARRNAFVLHLATCIIIAATPLMAACAHSRSSLGLTSIVIPAYAGIQNYACLDVGVRRHDVGAIR